MININEGKVIDEKNASHLFSKKLITLSDKRFKVPDNLKRICILFSDGDIIVEINNKKNLTLISFLTTCNKRGFKIKDIFFANMSLIRKIYETNSYSERERITDEQPMEKSASELLKRACQVRASDIHIEVKEHEATIFFRINGDMYKIGEIASGEAHSLLASLYNAADNSDATYKLYAFQSARIFNGGRILMPAELQSLRLQFNPLASGGRYMVARLLYGEKKWLQRTDMSGMGFHESQVRIINDLMMEPEGINLVAGPTGSGKSTTLKIILENMYIEKEQTVNIISIEDPPEYDIEGTTQLSVTNVETEEERGMAYNKAIVAALRSDPDIIMPGEARDASVIKLVFTAAMTGHQVWTSIHANSAIAVISRLRDQGVEEYKLTDQKLLTGIISQRLVKRLCNNCKKNFCTSATNTRFGIKKESILEYLGGYTNHVFINNPDGCKCCNNGYNGRIVVAETIKTDNKLLRLIYENKIEEAYNYWTNELDALTMYEHGWLKVIEGVIDPFDARLRIGTGYISEERKERIRNMERNISSEN
ncbi:Type II secretory pathway ATPase GspE/PulE or T4P pilus assembly pathway ATPase PilB [Izhakiella capsodis]|uniref:Type II secretory pathway ATPase GspE/PulE or T4P pilus assembly pathway ATPase PilB n=1 Tax=Izhakiella capsodis TaxID=1367852 RepID=A0A1I4W5K1_9GAMM|nr:ATPase, T2SS/T4P/T4SS family [Izhakiella capsodis]SFN08520.1 Type II secretory pathway ATPase GspE/PulE or T4P pilus assembly pathway ATPase PilB [Izhakiella capsodis]